MYTTYSQNALSQADYDALYSASMAMPESISIWIAIAGILAIIGGILTYFLFVKSKTDPKGKFAQWLKNFLNFKIMWIEPVVKVVYYIATIFIILFSFSFLSMGGYGVLSFFICLILGPIGVRLTYEFIMMFIRIWHNTQDIADNTAKKK